MFTDQIGAALVSDKTCAPVYGGAMASNKFAVACALVDSPRMFVVNTQPYGQSGEHWFSASLTKKTTVAFDSIGLPIDLYGDIADALAVRSAFLETTSVTLQNPVTNICGDYCVAFSLAAL